MLIIYYLLFIIKINALDLGLNGLDLNMAIAKYALGQYPVL